MHYQPLLLPDHVSVAHLLCPHPTITEHSKNPTNWDPEDCCACERLIKKPVVPVGVVDREKREHLEALS